MALLARLRAGIRAVADWQRPEGWTIVRGADVGSFIRDGKTVRKLGWEQHPVVQACVRAIVDIIAAVPLEVVQADSDGEIKVLPDHDLTALLDEPTPGLPGGRWRALTATHFLLYGNALTHIERNGRPKALHLIHPENVQAAYYDDREHRVKAYDWTDLHTGRTHNSLAEDILHFADLSGGDWIFGYPRAAAALQEILTDTEASHYVRQVVQNDGGVRTVFMMHESASVEQARAASDAWYDKRVGRGERGRDAFMPKLVGLHQLGMNLRELEFSALRQVTREGICTVFSVDPRIIGIASARGSEGGLSGQQYLEARRRLISQAATPLMTMMEQYLNIWLAPEFGTVQVRFSPDGLAELTENELETSQRAVSEYRGGVRTLEEARGLVSLPEERDPNHTLKAGLLGELRVGDMGALSKAKEVLMLEPPPPPGEPEPPEEEDERARTLPTTRVERTPEQRAEYWRRFDHLATEYEARLVRAAVGLFAQDRADVAALFRGLRQVDPVLTQAEADRLIRLLRELFGEAGPSRVRWAERMEAPIGATFRAGADELARELGLTFEPNNPRLDAAIRGRTARLAVHVGQTNAELVTATVLTARDQGWGMQQTADTVNETVFGTMASERAIRIARTESVGALNEAAFVAAQQTTVLREKEWLTQGDLKVRESHEDQDGQRIDMGAAFANGLRFPGDPLGEAAEVINCRCTLLYHA